MEKKMFRTQVTITHEMCVKYDYLDPYDCPAYNATKNFIKPEFLHINNGFGVCGFGVLDVGCRRIGNIDGWSKVPYFELIDNPGSSKTYDVEIECEYVRPELLAENN